MRFENGIATASDTTGRSSAMIAGAETIGAGAAFATRAAFEFADELRSCAGLVDISIVRRGNGAAVGTATFVERPVRLVLLK